MTLSNENTSDIFFSEKSTETLNYIFRALGPHASQEESLNKPRQKNNTKKFLKSYYSLSQSLDDGIIYLHM